MEYVHLGRALACVLSNAIHLLHRARSQYACGASFASDQNPNSPTTMNTMCVCVNAFAEGFSANGIHLPEKKIAIE